MRPSQLAKQHGHELAPTGEAPRVPLGLVLLDRLLELPAREQLQRLRKNAAVQTPMVVDVGEGGGWAPAGAGDGSEPQSVNSREAAAAAACRAAARGANGPRRFNPWGDRKS